MSTTIPAHIWYRSMFARSNHNSTNLNKTELCILLWDIDGTILRAARATTFTEYTRPVLESVFGTAGRIDDVPLTGMTDLQDILGRAGDLRLPVTATALSVIASRLLLSN